jgi:hypothetical protein
MYELSGARVTEIKASHLVYISHPAEVAGVIEKAARSASENTTRGRVLPSGIGAVGK